MPESDFSHIKEVYVDTGKLRLDFYDNDIIDGDSISVTVNNNVVVSHQLLSVKPVTVYAKVDLEHPEQEITMIAENMGSIPPNTALLIVTAGKNRYKLYLESTDKKVRRYVLSIRNQIKKYKCGVIITPHLYTAFENNYLPEKFTVSFVSPQLIMLLPYLG
ncbi:MAG: hypothetical protein C4330_03535 [Chitinophagaceae bacterium]